MGSFVTAPEVTRTYSQLATAIGLMSSSLEDSRKDISRDKIQELFKVMVQTLSPNVPLDSELVVGLTAEFIALQVKHDTANDIGLH